MSPWGWRPERTQGIWRHGASWFRPFAAAAPWLTVLVLLAMFGLIGGTLTAARGLLFDLPAGEPKEAASTRLVALVTPTAHDTMVMVDGTRYLLGEAVSVDSLSRDLAAGIVRTGDKSLLALVDRRVAAGELAKFAEVVRRSGVERLLMAERREERPE